MEKNPIKETFEFGLEVARSVGSFVMSRIALDGWANLPRPSKPTPDYPAFHSNEVIDATFVEEEAA